MIAEGGAEQVERANSSVRTLVVFIHGLWLLPNRWDRCAELFEASGYAAVKPGWPETTLVSDTKSGSPPSAAKLDTR